MWLKVFLLLVYILLLFVLSRMLEALSWYEHGYSGMLSRRLLDPMALSVAKLKALLEQRGVSYDGIVEKSELTSLVDSSGPVSAEEVAMAQADLEEPGETNFTCGAHFIEQVEDAKDSVWLVQVVRHRGQVHIAGDMRWKALRKKVTKFGVRTGFMDCSLDQRYCSRKGWHSPLLLLALPSEFQKKANIAMHNYSGPIHETVVLRWIRDKLAERVMKIHDPTSFQQRWQRNFSHSSLNPEIRAVLFTETVSPPLSYSALTVKFPGCVKFGMVTLESKDKQMNWKHVLGNNQLPSYVFYSTEKNYTYGTKPGEQFSFASMERFLRFLYPCLNDIFIISFCAANLMSLFELFVSNCGVFRRITKCLWCIIKYNIIVIMLWLPIIGIFQMPFLDRVPLFALKLERIFTTSQLGTICRGDFSFFQNHPVYVYISFLFYLASVTYLCKKYRQEEEEPEGWLTFNHPASLVHLRPNNLLEPMGLSRYDFLSRLDVLGSRLTRQSLWLQPAIPSDYIQHLHTWRYSPCSVGEQAAKNVKDVEVAMGQTPEFSKTHQTFNHHSRDVEESRKSVPKCDQCVSNWKQTSSNQEVEDHVDSMLVSSAANSREPSPSQKGAVSSSCDVSPSGEFKLPPESSTQSQTSICQWCGSYCPGTQATAHRSEGARELRLPVNANHGQVTSASDSSPTSVPSSTEHSQDTCELERKPSTTRSVSWSMGFPLGYIESQQCVICLEEYSPSVMLCGLPCGHVFHETCIITWLNREKHFCPMCRWPSYQIPGISPN